MKINNIDIGGKTVEVHVDPYGHFTVKLDGINIGSGESLEQAKAKASLKVSQSKVRVSVPYLLLSGEGIIQRCEATGIHSTNGNFMVKVDGKTAQVRGHELGAVYREDTQREVLDQIVRNRTEVRRLERENKALHAEHSFNAALVVRMEIKAAQS